MSEEPPLLEVSGLNLRFGGLKVLTDVNLRIAKGEIHGLVGPNGAGKTSLFNCINGLYRPQSGTIRLRGHDLLSLTPHQLAGYGIARTFQHPAFDPEATVLENVLIGAHSRMRGGFATGALRLPPIRADERRATARSRELLAWADLSDVADHSPASLPYASQKLVELVRALLIEPVLLMLDEPAGGLAHGEVAELAERIRRLSDDFNLTILLVEHHMGFIGSLTDRVDILVEGRNIVTGTAAEIQRHPAVIEAYLGQAV